jgi:DNA excision repair protein ERCC-4
MGERRSQKFRSQEFRGQNTEIRNTEHGYAVSRRTANPELQTLNSKSMQNVLVLVDDRERPSGVVEELEKLSGVIVKVEHLTVGDYHVDGMVIIERKTAADFARSLIDGRLFSQAGQMASSLYRPAYVLEGKSAEWLELGLSREAMQGALITLMLIFDIPVFRSSDPAESARIIFYIGSQLARLRDPAHVPYVPGKAKRKRNRQLRLLQALPGIGPDRARRLLGCFKTVRACFDASATELMKVEGIGPKTAAAIVEVIGEAGRKLENRVQESE